MPTCSFCDASVPATATRCPSCGAEQPERGPIASPALEDELCALIQQGAAIPAIKRYREVTGAGLAEAKRAVDALIESGSFSSTSNSSRGATQNLESDVLSVLSREGKIAAIKLYRDRTKVPLNEAKAAVEEIAARHGIAAKGGGCAGMVFMAVLAISAAVSLL